MKYRTIVADPPWSYPEGFLPSHWGGRSWSLPSPYPQMTVSEIMALPVNELAATDARLFIWATNRYLPDVFKVISAWGFTYKQTLTWIKTGNRVPFGGSIAPNHAEWLVVSTMGSPVLQGRLKSSVIEAPKPNAGQRGGVHSAKPECFLDYIEQVSPGPYLELFARRNRLGWDTWGNESLEHVSLR